LNKSLDRQGYGAFTVEKQAMKSRIKLFQFEYLAHDEIINNY